jgi:FeS assembly SUF system protein
MLFRALWRVLFQEVDMADTVNEVEQAGQTEQSEQGNVINQDAVIEALRECYDPEIPVNIVDLGLVYEINIGVDSVGIIMTLTAMGCPVAGDVMAEVEARLLEVPGVKKANVELTFDPPWSPDRMSEDARWELGIG